MPTVIRSRFLAILAIVFSASVPLVGQDEVNDEVVELSPFVVSEDSTVGYLATETLSGTRLRTGMGDVGVSLDALTEEMLADIGANDASDALDQSGNVSTWDKSGDQSEVQNQIWFSNPYNSRGFLSSAALADFFEMGMQPIDFYSLTRLTIAKGPNAVLYGIGSPGGVLSVERKKALFGRDLTTLELKTDSWGSFRYSLDLSRELVEGKWALRLGGLYFDEKEFVKPAGLLRRGAFGTVTWRPTRKTSLTLFVEKGDEDRTFRYGGMSYDSITPWLNAGKPVHSVVGSNFDASHGSGLDYDGKLTVEVQGQPAIPATTWRRMGRSERSEIFGHPNIAETRQKAYTEETAIYDYKKVQLIGDGLRRRLDWEDFALILQHEILPRLNLELGFNRLRTDHRTVQAFPGFQLMVDPNEVLPNGESNPNFLSTYIETSRTEVVAEENTATTARATLTYELNLNNTRVFGRVPLGRLTFVGMYEHREANSLFAGFRRVNTEPGRLVGFNANNLRDWANKLSTRAYVQTDLTPDGANVQPYYKSDFTPIDGPDVRSGWVRHTSPRDIEEGRDTALVALQYNFWKAKDGYDRVILTAGLRDDRSSSHRTTYPLVDGNIYAGENFRGSPWEVSRGVLYDGTMNFGAKDPVEITDEDPTKTYSAVFKLLHNISLTYSYSDVLISSSALFKDIYGDVPPATIGETTDIGIRGAFLGNRLHASLTVFETTANNQRESSVRGPMTNWINDMWEVIDPTARIEEERWVTMRNDRSEGMEFSLIGNPLRGWNLRLNVSRIDTIIESRLPVTDRYIAEFLPLWTANSTSALSAAVTFEEYQTVGDATAKLEQYVADIHATEGTAPFAQREWKVVLQTSYDFREGFMKGIGVGGGFRWQAKDMIGFAIDENNILDPDRPFYGEDVLVVDFLARYTFKLNSARIRLQLNVYNLLEDGGTFPRRALDDLSGSPYFTRQQVIEPRSFALTTTINW